MVKWNGSYGFVAFTSDTAQTIFVFQLRYCHRYNVINLNKKKLKANNFDSLECKSRNAFLFETLQIWAIKQFKSFGIITIRFDVWTEIFGQDIQ